MTAPKETINLPQSAGASATLNLFKPKFSALLTIVEQYFEQISAPERTEIAAGETNSSTVATLVHMFHDLTRTLTADFLRFVVPMFRGNLLESSQAEVNAVLKAFDISLEDTMSLVFAEVLLVLELQCEDVKKLTALLETEVRTRAGSLLSTATRSTLCRGQHVLFVPGTMSCISTLRLMVSHTLKCLKTYFGEQNSSQWSDNLLVKPSDVSIDSGAEYNDVYKPQPTSKSSKGQFFLSLFKSQFEKLLDKVQDLFDSGDLHFLVKLLDCSSSHVRSTLVESERCEIMETCTNMLTMHTVVRNHLSVLGVDTIKDQLENIGHQPDKNDILTESRQIVTSSDETVDMPQSAGPSPPLNLFKPKISALLTIAKQYFEQISALERGDIAAGETNSSTVATLTHMCHELTQTITADFLRFAVPMCQGSQTEVRTYLETLDISLEDTMAVLFADVLLVPQQQCEDMKKLAALLETKVKTRVSSLLSIANKSSLCQEELVLFVPGNTSYISTLDPIMNQTLKSLRRFFGGQDSCRVPENLLSKAGINTTVDTGGAEHLNTQQSTRLTMHTVVRNNLSVLGFNTIKDQLENIHQRWTVVEESAGHDRKNTLRCELRKLAKELTEGVYNHVMTRKSYKILDVPEGKRLSDSVLDLERNLTFTNLSPAARYMRVEDAVERYFQQVSIFLQINPPQPASICIDNLDTTAPLPPEEDNTSRQEYSEDVTSAEENATRNLFKPNMGTLQPIVKQYLRPETIRIAAGKTTSSTVATLAHMCHDLTRTLTADFLRFVVPRFQGNLLESSQAVVNAVLKTFDISLEDTMSLVFAEVLLVPEPQCEDVKKLTELLETEVKTRAVSLLSMATRSTLCRGQHVLFVPGTMSCISTLRLMVSHTLKCLKTFLGAHKSSQVQGYVPKTYAWINRTGSSGGAEYKDTNTLPPPSKIRKVSFFHVLFRSQFETMLDKVEDLCKVADLYFLVNLLDCSSSHVRLTVAESQTCETVGTCASMLTMKNVVNLSAIGYDTIKDQLEDICQRGIMVDKSTGDSRDITLRHEIRKLAKKLTEGVYRHVMTGKTDKIPDVPEGRLLSDFVVLDPESNLTFMNFSPAAGYMRVEDAVERYLQQVMLFLEINPPQPASICIDSLDTTTPLPPEEDNTNRQEYGEDMTSSEENVDQARSTGPSSALNLFKPKMGTLQPIVKQCFKQILRPERIRIVAGEASSSTVFTLTHMCHDLTQTLTADFLRFVVPRFQGNMLESSQAEVNAVLKTFDISLEDTMSLVFAEVLVTEPQCADVKKLTALLETEVKTRTVSLLSMATRSTLCRGQHVLFVPGTMSCSSTLRLMVSHTLKCLKTFLGAHKSSQGQGYGPMTYIYTPIDRTGSSGAEYKDMNTLPPPSKIRKVSFFHVLFRSQFEKMLDKVEDLYKVADLYFLVNLLDCSSSHVRLTVAESQRCETMERGETMEMCASMLTMKNVVNLSVIGYDTIKDQMEDICQRGMVVDKSAGDSEDGTLRQEIRRLAKELTEGVYHHVMTGKTYRIPDVPKGRRLSESVILDFRSNLKLMNISPVFRYVRVEDAVERYLQQVLVFLEMNSPQIASICIDSLDTTTPLLPEEDNPRRPETSKDMTSSEELVRTPTPLEEKITHEFMSSLVSKLIKHLPKKTRRLLQPEDTRALIQNLLDFMQKDIGTLIVSTSEKKVNWKKVIKAAVKHIIRIYPPDQIMEAAIRPEDTTFFNVVKTFLTMHLMDLRSGAPKKNRIRRLFSALKRQ